MKRDYWWNTPISVSCILFSIYFVRWSWPGTKHKRCWNENEQQCAWPRFVHPKTKLCSLPLNFVELPNQLVLSTLLKLSNLRNRAVWTSITICDIITVLDVSFLNYQKWKQQVEVGEQLKLGKFILKGFFHGSAHAPVLRNLVCVPARNKATFWDFARRSVEVGFNLKKSLCVLHIGDQKSFCLDHFLFRRLVLVLFYCSFA